MNNRRVVFKLFATLLILLLILQYFYLHLFRRVPKRNTSASLFYIEDSRTGNHSSNVSNNLESQVMAYRPNSSNEECSQKRSLVGYVGANIHPPSMERISRVHWDLEDDGHFSPNCSHSDKVAIIVPFRDRIDHLRIFLHNIHPFLKRQLIEYNIYVVEQGGSEPFNRAMLFNVGYAESIKRYNFTCFIFHDVDLIPENDRNIYSCPSIMPRHMSVAIDTLRYRLPYRTIFGGIAAFRRDQFILVNGFSNRYWGWGAEDDDMSNRIAYHGLFISRYSPDIARYKMLKHKHQKVNFNRYKVLHKGKQRFLSDGLCNLNYTVEEIKLNKLYTLVKVKLAKT